MNGFAEFNGAEDHPVEGEHDFYLTAVLHVLNLSIHELLKFLFFFQPSQQKSSLVKF